MRIGNSVIQNGIDKYKRFPVTAKAAMWFVACTMLQKCIGFITVPIFTRLMPTEEYGLYSTYLSWESVMLVICTLNMHSCIYINNYTKAETDKERDEAAIPLLSLSAVITLVLFVLYLIFHKFLDAYIGLPFGMVCIMFGVILCYPPINFWSWQQRFEFRYMQLVFRTLSMVIANAVLGILFVYIASKNEALARALSIFIVYAVFGGVFYLYFIKRAKKVFSVKGWKRALKVQLPLLPHSLSLSVLSSSDRIMIRNIVDSAAAGIYSVAYSAGYVVNVLKNSIVDAMRPWIYKKIKTGEFADIKKTVNTVMVIITIITFIFIAFAPEVIFIMAPSQYREAIYVIPPVAASSYFTFLYNMFSIVGMYYEKTGKIMWASVSGAVLNLALNAVFIPLYGFVAAAYTTLVCYMFFSLAHYIIMKSICKKELGDIKIYDMRFIVFMSIFVLAMTFLFSFVYKAFWVRYSIIAALLIIVLVKRKHFAEILRDIKKKV